MAAIQVSHDGSIDNLPDLDKRYQLAELYAQGGILLLRELMADASSVGNELAAELIELLPPPVEAIDD